MLSRQLVLGVALGAGISLAGGYWALRSGPTVQPPRAQRVAPDPALVAQLSRLENRLIAFEASARLAAAPSAAVTQDPAARAAEREQGAAAPSEADPDLLPAGDEAAAEAGRTLLNTAFDRQRWDEKSREQFRNLRSTMPPHEAFELTRRLAAGINARQISVEMDGPPI